MRHISYIHWQFFHFYVLIKDNIVITFAVISQIDINQDIKKLDSFGRQ